MSTSDNYTVVLDENDKFYMDHLANCISSIPSEDEIIFCQESKIASLQLPERLRDAINNFVTHGSETGYLLIKYNLSINGLPDTPPNNNLFIGEKTCLAKIQSMIINYKSDIIAYEAEGHGRLFQDVVPVKNMETQQTSVSSKTVLELHTEQAFSNLKPDFLCLACLRGNPEAYTYVLPVNRILNVLSNEEIELLFEPLWMIGVDLSFKLTGVEFVDGDLRGPISILNGSREDPFLVFDQDLMTGINERANSILKKIVDIYYSHRIGHNLQPGEIILIDNRRATHGRSSFSPMYNGKDRFLIRCFGTLSLSNSDNFRMPKKRTIMAKFS